MLRLELPGQSTEFQDSTNRLRSPSSAPPGVSRFGRTLVCRGILPRFSFGGSRALASDAEAAGRFFLSLARATSWPLCVEVVMLLGGVLAAESLDSVGFLRAISRRCLCFRSLTGSATKPGEASRSCDPAILAGEESGCCCSGGGWSCCCCCCCSDSCCCCCCCYCCCCSGRFSGLERSTVC